MRATLIAMAAVAGFAVVGVGSISAAPISKNGRDGATLAAVEYTKEYRYPATPESLARVVPSRIAAQAMRDLPEKWKR